VFLSGKKLPDWSTKLHLINRSCRYFPFQLIPLIDVVRKHARFADLVNLVVEDRWDGGVTGGWSSKRPSKRTLEALHLKEVVIPTRAAPSLIKLDVAFGAKYPRTSLHVEEVGEVTFNNWQEEILFVLAHEQGHIDDFWTQPLEEHEAEVDAERFAVNVLATYRNQRS
jgi:hypothetical protein